MPCSPSGSLTAFVPRGARRRCPTRNRLRPNARSTPTPTGTGTWRSSRRRSANAVAGLDPKDRLRLRYYYAQELTLAETGRLLREHEATVSRQLARTRKAIRREVERQLGDAALSPAEIDRCFECVTEDAGPLDLDEMLAESAGDARKPEPIVLSKKAK